MNVTEDNLSKFEYCVDDFDITGLTQYAYIVGKNKIHLHLLQKSIEKRANDMLLYLFLLFVHINYNIPTICIYCICLMNFLDTNVSI